MHLSMEHAFVRGCAAETPVLGVADSASIAMNAEMRTIGIPSAITDRRLKSLLELGSSPFVQCCQVADDALEL